jgi:hypothetical protein
MQLKSVISLQANNNLHLMNYPNLHMVELKQMRVFLIAVSYHSNPAMGQTVVLSEKPATG